MIPNINEIRQSSISIEKINECKQITETQKSIDKLVNECKKRAEKGYGYLNLEWPGQYNISIDNVYDIEKAFKDAGYEVGVGIEHWWTIPDQVISFSIQWKKDPFYDQL
jgi:hypothetical protein